MDAWPTFWSRNKPLYEQMLASGCTFKRNERTAHFVDADGEYVGFPKGYITGPSYAPEGGNPHPHYASVCLGGSWAQRGFATRQEAVDWALAYEIRDDEDEDTAE